MFPKPNGVAPSSGMIADVDANEKIGLDLDASERVLLQCGLCEWGGPAMCTEELAIAMGFRSVGDLYEDGRRIAQAVMADEELSRLDWLRALLATEIVFISNTVGSGLDWRHTTGISDEQSFVTLRAIQGKLTREVRGLIGNGLGTIQPSR